jgi:hypothetical protein
MPAKSGGSGPTGAKDIKIRHHDMSSNACDAGRLQAEQRKRSKYRIIMMPSNASDASQEAPGRPAQRIKIQVSLQAS